MSDAPGGNSCVCPAPRPYLPTCRRGLATEPWLQAYLRQVTARSRVSLAPDQRRQLEARDAAEAQQLAAACEGPVSAEEQALPARTTGDASWLAARGEDGSSSAAALGRSQQAAVLPPGTRYRLAKDEGLWGARADGLMRLCGGAARASGENSPSEMATAAFDGSPHSKWLDFSGPRGNAWLEYRLPAEQAPAVLGAYALTSANDSPERDPRHVLLEAWSEGAWVGVGAVLGWGLHRTCA